MCQEKRLISHRRGSLPWRGGSGRIGSMSSRPATGRSPSGGGFPHDEGTCSDSRSDGIGLLDHERRCAWTLLPDELLRRDQRLRRRGRLERSCVRCRSVGPRDDRRSQHVGGTRNDCSGPCVLLRTGPLLADAVVHTAEDRSAKVQLNRSVAISFRRCKNARPKIWPSVLFSALVARRGATEQWNSRLGPMRLRVLARGLPASAQRSSSGITISDSRVRRRLWAIASNTYSATASQISGNAVR